MPQKVLFVDDEANVLAALKNMLRKETYHILTANSADEAIATLQRKSVDVIVTDEKMPGVPGTKLLAQVRQEYPDIVRIIITGHADLDIAMRAINNGEVYRFLIKPCNGLDLAVTIRRALQHKLLLTKAHELLKTTSEQSAILKELEEKHPGITKVKKNNSGALMVDEPQIEFDTLIQKMDDELKKSKELIHENVAAT